VLISYPSPTISPRLPSRFLLYTHAHPTLYTRAGAISSEQAVSLNVLIDQGDERVKRVFCLYEADKDVYRLIDALKIFKSREEVTVTLACVCCVRWERDWITGRQREGRRHYARHFVALSAELRLSCLKVICVHFETNCTVLYCTAVRTAQ
jgi:hypothetical protein